MTQPSHDTVATRPPRLYLLPSLERPRRALSPRLGYAVAALVVGLGLFASVTPSPLYRSYSVLWHFSPLTLTLIYATYAFGVLASLLLAGGASDDVGRLAVRRPRLAGSRDRRRLERGQRGSARPAPEARPRRRRTHDCHRRCERHRSRRARLVSARPARDPAACPALRRAARPLRRRLCRRLLDAGAGREAWPLPPHGRAPKRPGRRAAAVLPGRPRGALFMVDRRPLLLPRPAAGRPSLQLEQRDRLRQRHRRTRRCGCRRPAADRTHCALDRRRCRLDRSRRRNGADRLRSRPRLERRLSGRLDPRRRRLRRRLPRRPPRAHSSHPASAPRRSHVGLLRRRLHLPLAAGRPRRHRRRPHRAADDLRDLRKRRCRDRSDRRLRSLARPPHHPAARRLAGGRRARERRMTTAAIASPGLRTIGRLGCWLSVRHSLRVEAAGALTVYALYQVARGLVGADAAVADGHAHRLVALERSLHLFAEANVQRAAQTLPDLTSLFGVAYLTLHLA